MNPLYSFLLIFLILHNCTATDPLGNYCNDNSNIISRKVSANIASFLDVAMSKTALTGYIATTTGTGKDKAYGLSECRGDVSSQSCFSCIKDAAKQIRDLCPNHVDARIWYDFCFLRYSQENFIGKIDTGFSIFYYNVENVTDPEEFNEELGKLSTKIRSEAVVPKNKGFGKGATKLTSFETLYALDQCTRDLAPVDCARCLAIAVGNFEGICDNQKGCRVLYSSCYIRYELYPFFFPLDKKGSLAGNLMTIVHQ